MDVALLAARLLLAAVFLVAGLAKLADRRGSRQGMLDFGVPRRLAGPLGVAIPLAELAVAVALVPKATAWWGALGALFLLAIFIAGIAVNLARGRKPDCRCFGQLQSAPVGWRTLARNGVLAAVAAFVLVAGRDDPGWSAVGWLGEPTTAQVAAAAAFAVLLTLVAAQTMLLLNLLRQSGRVLIRLEALEGRALASGDGVVEEKPPAAQQDAQYGLPVGSPAPMFALPGLYGETLTLDFLRVANRPVLLVFADPGCGPCNALMPEIGMWQRDYSDRLTVAVITRGDPEANRAKAAEDGLKNVLLQKDREVAAAYEEPGTPSAVLVGSDGMIGSRIAAGADAIRALVRRALSPAGTPSASPPTPPPGSPASAPATPDATAQNGSGDGAALAARAPAGLNVGDPAPPLRLRDLQGRTVNLAGFRGTKTLVLFWNPGCSFCSQMLDELKAWEADPPEAAPKLLVVSTPDAAANQAMGFRSPVVLDAGFATGAAFGASGTPSAVLVDEQGQIASELAVGGPAVLALAGARESPASAVPPAVPALGEPAPMFELPDLDGRTVALADYRGRTVLLVFWNPGCGFCRQMVEDMNAWESERGPADPQPLLISTGTAEANRELEVASPVVLDQHFAVAASFGASGTPMAVLIDEHGRVASELVGGAPAVLELAGASQAAGDPSTPG